jgi:hypothetical protein
MNSPAIALSPDEEDRAASIRGGKVLTFNLGKEGYGITITKIREIIGMMPTSEIRALDASEDQEIWSHLPEPAVPVDTLAEEPRYWKIAPGRNAIAWPEWKERGIAAIGWPELGYLTNVTREEFDKRSEECAAKHDYGMDLPPNVAHCSASLPIGVLWRHPLRQGPDEAVPQKIYEVDPLTCLSGGFPFLIFEKKDRGQRVSLLKFQPFSNCPAS